MRLTLRGALLRSARALGMDVSPVAPGTVLLTRRWAAKRQRSPIQLTRDAAIVGPGTKKVQVSKVRESGWLVTRKDVPAPERLLLETHVLYELGKRHVAWLLESYGVDCVLDVGANTGQFGQALRRSGYTGHIISFEPVPQFFEALSKAAASDPRWSVHAIALGDSEGTVPIHVQRTFSSLLPSSEYGRKRFGTLRESAANDVVVDVPLRRLDGLLDSVLPQGQGAEPRLFLKMDTQGFDLQVFSGLGERASQFVGLQSELGLLLIYEGMPRMSEALAAYESAGFEVSGLYPVTREPDGRVIEYDCVMVRSGAHPG